jgi:hypothetical protein
LNALFEPTGYARHPLIDRLRFLTTPTFVLYGQYDWMVPFPALLSLSFLLPLLLIRLCPLFLSPCRIQSNSWNIKPPNKQIPTSKVSESFQQLAINCIWYV